MRLVPERKVQYLLDFQEESSHTQFQPEVLLTHSSFAHTHQFFRIEFLYFHFQSERDYHFHLSRHKYL